MPRSSTLSTSVSRSRRPLSRPPDLGADLLSPLTVIGITGVFFCVAGTYASVQSIINSCESIQLLCASGNPRSAQATADPYRLCFPAHQDHEGAIKAPFQCTNSGFTFTR